MLSTPLVSLREPAEMTRRWGMACRSISCFRLTLENSEMRWWRQRGLFQMPLRLSNVTAPPPSPSGQ
jgi:hypothetical protein